MPLHLSIVEGQEHSPIESPNDQMDVIPFDKLETFFTDAFADES